MGFGNIFARRGHSTEFGPNDPRPTVDLPDEYRRSLDWVPQLGDIFPNFHADSTRGHIDFHDWAEGRWVYLFSHPSTRSGISATEVASIASAAEFFRERGVAVMGLCNDPAASHARWEAELAALFRLRVDFPVIDDRQAHLSRAFGMIHPKLRETMAIRKSFILDPSMRVRLMFEYPLDVGRSIDETLRAIDALQAADRTQLGVPADWETGDSLLVPPFRSTEDVRNAFGGVEVLAPFLRLVPRCPQARGPVRTEGLAPNAAPAAPDGPADRPEPRAEAQVQVFPRRADVA